MQLRDNTFLVTGAASGLGEATATVLVEAGARVVIADLAESDGKATAARLGDAAVFAPIDITDEASFGPALDAAEAIGPLRGVVHCAGRGGDRLRILDKEGNPNDLESFRNVLEINLIGTYNVLRCTAARMARNEPLDGERGSIVLTASVAAFDGQIGQTSYTASKAAVHGMTLVAARDLASFGIRVNTIAPGLFDTPMLARLRSDIREGLAAGVPFPKRLGRPQDYAAMATALLTNSYANGETIRLDGAIRMAPR
ncbi:3-hydroxyacyl-CoA dehydrogenase [Rhodococcus sp. ACPA4]|uniref:NAD(P)-dependent dehydrogenase (Short-subunit alcohol dehydrogenase family) n=1 Tax=Nocardia globerula TaxID=1818 RepID=A0A652YHG2_NOCGL|nr:MULTISPECIES: SDR family NAD(P)-dependent oxidoreductase [Rhodococcus]NMD64284.1 SDR family oxidoreductase [Nocardia globerula]MCE4265772.1 SDR family oxidoreductase [Rhodococcus globerulus]MDV8071054.1 SDR family oxidoreductase [Rhodococcus sp. IEGM 1366]NRI69986.1 SDR family oxidoreductase [Rhodococcus sp. MS16]PBC42928.1 3-hydroxyacyl-CoA dehydrogenase [Rhodococcus sp. ACPA4]